MHGGQNSAIASVSANATSYAHRDKLYIIQFYDRIDNGTYPAGGQSFLTSWVNAVTAPLKESDWGMCKFPRSRAHARWASLRFKC